MPVKVHTGERICSNFGPPMSLYSARTKPVIDMSSSVHTLYVHIQYPSIKSLRSTIVERSFYGASVFAERRSRTVSVPFRLSSVPFSFRSACEPARPVRGIGERFFRIRG